MRLARCFGYAARPSAFVLAAAISATWFTSNATTTGAGLVETFSYGNGNLTTVSGGAWQSWGGGGNATVVGGAARFEDTTDLIRAFPAVLIGPGDSATFSFTLNVAVANTSEGYEVAFEPSSAPFGFGNTNYGSGLALGFDYLDAPAGRSSIQVAEGSGNFSPSNAGNNIVQIGTMTTGVAHTISISLLRGVTSTAYPLFLDGSLLHSGTLVINDPRGINSVEFDQAGSTGSPVGSALLDDLCVVPEPATSVLLIIVSAAFLSRRRHPDRLLRGVV
jgi:hypothetical protein